MEHAHAKIKAATGRDALPELTPADAVGRDIRVTCPQKVTRPEPQVDHKTEVASLGSIKTTVMSFATMHLHGDLLVKYLRARKKVFVDRLKWHVPYSEGMEFDQYDTPECRWVILHEFGEIIGGVRLAPTTAQCGIYTYMLNDAQRGILEDIPTDVLFFKAPVEQGIWEASRFFIVEDVPAKRRLAVQNLLFRAMNDAAVENGALFILGIVPYIWSRWSRRLDVSATPIGAKFSIETTKSQAVLFNTKSLED